MVIRFDRGKTLLLLLGSAAFVALGVFFVLHPQAMAEQHRSPAMVLAVGWMSIALFGAGFLLGLRRLAGGVAVSLDQGGVEMARLPFGAPRRLAWAEIAAFRIERVKRTRIVKARLRNAAFTLADVHGGGGGGEVGLPAGLEMEPERLLALLEEWRMRYSAAESK